MTPFYADELVTLYAGDCIEVMRQLPEASVDAVVTDPPYGLEFMGKDWDRLSPDPDIGKARKVGLDKPNGAPDQREGNKGGTWFGSRDAMVPNYHRTTNAKCRKCGKWRVSGGHDGKGNTLGCKCASPDFPNVEREAALLMQEWHHAWAIEALRVTKPGGYLLAFGGTRTHHRLVCGLEDAGWIIRDELDWIYASGFPKGKANLKPAHEPIVLARKPGPLQPLGIDAGRIGVADGHGGGANGTSGFAEGYEKGDGFAASQVGRWPSNVLLSDPELFDQPNDEVVGSGATVASGLMRAGTAEGMGMFALNGSPMEQDTYGDTGGYSRFFIIPKSARADREPVLRGQLGTTDEIRAESAHSTVCAKCGRQRVNVPGAACQCPEPEWVRKPQTARENSHATVKPTDLMRHLVRLVTPPGGLVLDCFLGSGTTAIAANAEGFRCLGIEREREYLDIALARLAHQPLGLGLDVAAPTRKRSGPIGRAPGTDTHATNGAVGKGWSGGWTSDNEVPA